MKRAELRIPEYIAHILEAIGRIAQYTEAMDEESFLRNILVQDAVIRNIEVIGEAACNIERASPAFIADHHGTPWSTMIAMRNRVSHGYMTINFSLVWKTLQNDLPALAKPIRALRDHG
ncbi:MULTISPECIES: DUF86 domain-containing protein [unclassified Thiomonas]|uniref:HepT-like ribonuclease domain-containing protein n=1 Tax=unclassified Thiomonas TaxID=2625466 RepID=UPI0004DB9D82|nr:MULTISPECIES: DUF86 domain-containing protein [unclassified Thiomonas]CDW92427.1 conserved hypothetical protein [Thiomonas sp. CB2]VDY05884.1 conserved protein of unknown function [Thiomonas sp. Bio17B3]VDY10819.1 conserved protein of unknown function [Thiomonas sp. Sup16B3]VDY14147.1 conserved protein of unknown function [Thiomonas sp. OC7]VDY16658.1 conserved protein of unknown function [Thiomonas sp. CB2]